MESMVSRILYWCTCFNWKKWFEDIVEIDLDNRETEMFKESVEVKETNSALDGLI